MQRIKEEFLDRLEEVFSLRGYHVLEIGCGNGTRSEVIAQRCLTLHAIDPDKAQIEIAKNRGVANAEFKVGIAEKLEFADNSFDTVIFTLSLHHVQFEKMNIAIDEAIRVVNNNGHIVFLEPTENGTFFDAEIMFEASDGDEREKKKAAYAAMQHHKKLTKVSEIEDETIFQFESVTDFVKSLEPKKNLDEVENFLQSCDFVLNAHRRINIFKVQK